MAIELTRDFPSLDRVRLAVFATGCALHVSALLLTLARPTRRDQLQRWLDELVELAKSPNAAAAQQLNASIEAAPEAGADDSNVADYYVMRALSVVSYAAQTWTDDNPAQYAQWSADEVVDLMREITFTLGNSAPPLEELEVAAQRDLLARMEMWPGVSTVSLLNVAKESPVLALSRAAARDYARMRGWPL